MAWDTIETEILRVLIDDMGTPRNSDANLKRVLVVSAFQLVSELDFAHTFTVNISAGTISPDPTETATLDDSFVNLTCLKAACIIDRGSASASSRKAFYVKDGTSIYDNREGLKGKLEILKQGWCAVFEDARLEYLTSKTSVAGAIVMTPFRLYAGGNHGFITAQGYPGDPIMPEGYYRRQ